MKALTLESDSLGWYIETTDGAILFGPYTNKKHAEQEKERLEESKCWTMYLNGRLASSLSWDRYAPPLS